jgi:thymidylate kinase
VRTAFLDLAGRYNERFVVVDAARGIDAVAADIAEIVMPRLVAARLK